MSHDNRVYLNTTLNNVVVIDSEQNQITVTNPITQVIEITQSPTPTVTVVEETPNNVSVTEAIGNTVIVSATGPQGIQGIRGMDPELTALEQFTGSIQSEVNSLRAATSSYVQNSLTSSMLQPYVLTSSTSSMLQPYVLTSQTGSMSVATASLALTASLAPNYVLTSSTSSMSVLSSSYAATASRLEGMFTLTTNSAANNRTISSLGGLAFNNNASIDQDANRSIIFKTTPDGNVGSLATRLTISGSGPIGINTTPLDKVSLIVSGGVILNGTTSFFQNYDSWPVQLQAGQVNNGIGIASDVVAQYSYGASSPYYQFGSGGSATWRLSTSTNQSFFIQSIQPSVNTRFYVSSSGNVGIGTSTPSSNLHIFRGSSGTTGLGLVDGTVLVLENDTTNYINFRSPNDNAAGLAFSSPNDTSAGYISFRQSTGEMYYSSENNNGYHRFLTADTERLRVANTTTTVRNNLVVSASCQFTSSGDSLLLGQVNIANNLHVSGASSQFTSSGTSQLTGQVNIGNVPSITTSVLNVGANMHLFGNVYMSGTTNFIQNAVSARANIHFGSNGNSWLNNGNFGLGTSSPTRRLDVVGSSSFSGDVTISKLLTLTPQHPLPTLNLTAGAFAVSSSTPPKPYFWDGTDWYALY